MNNNGLKTTVPGRLEDVKPKVVDALKQQGFGVLTEIDVRKTLREKIGADFEPYLILGACNPQFAHRALQADRSIGLLLPCNVVLRQSEDRVEVSIVDPEDMFRMTEPSTQAALKDLAKEAGDRLRSVVSALAPT